MVRFCAGLKAAPETGLKNSNIVCYYARGRRGEWVGPGLRAGGLIEVPDSRLEICARLPLLRQRGVEGGTEMAQTKSSPKVYDVVIVGSGAGGGIAAYVLTRAGAKCLMLEAGSWYDTAKESKMFEWNYNAPHRGAATPQKPFGYFDAMVGGWQVEGEPYTAAAGNEGRGWGLHRAGRRNKHWRRICPHDGPSHI